MPPPPVTTAQPAGPTGISHHRLPIRDQRSARADADSPTGTSSIAKPDEPLLLLGSQPLARPALSLLGRPGWKAVCYTGGRTAPSGPFRLPIFDR